MLAAVAAEWRFQFNPKVRDCKPTWFQYWIYTRQSRNVIAVAARRSAKTSGARFRLIKRAFQNPNGVVGYVGPTLKQAKRLMWTPLMRDLRDPQARKAVAEINKTDMSILFKNGARLYIFGAEQPEGIRGGDPGFDELICDEADDPNYDDAFFNEIVGPALSDQQGTLVQIGSPKGRGRLYREYRKGWEGSPADERMPGYESIQVTAIEAGILAKEEIELARRIRPARSFRQEYEATFEAPVGVVYDEWEEKVHVVNSAPYQFQDIIACVDWGTGNRGSMLILGVDSVWIQEGEDQWEEPRIWVLDEISEAGTGYDDDGWWRHARTLQDRWGPRIWYADPAGGLEGYIRQLKNALRGYATQVKPADNQVLPGIAKVQSFLHHKPESGVPPRLLVHERCKWVRKEIADYRWQPHRGREDEFTNLPVKVDDHCLDALRYGVFTAFCQSYGSVKRRRSMEDERGR